MNKEERPLGNEHPKKVGEEVLYQVAAPGIGTVMYRITRIDEKGCYWGILIKDASRILDPSEVI